MKQRWTGRTFAPVGCLLLLAALFPVAGVADAQNAGGYSSSNPEAAAPAAPPRDAAGVVGRAAEREPEKSDASPVPNADRLALDLRTIDLDMHLNADTGAVTTRARVRLRNAGASPLGEVALQVSSVLDWHSARIMPQSSPEGMEGSGPGTRLPVKQYRVTTDADHTGAANELVLQLPKPLAPGAELSLDLYYGGTLGPGAERLLRLGAPAERAAAADWDTVSPEFIGLRGFGNVLWFPVAAPAALLAEGERFQRTVEQERERTAHTAVRLSLQLEHTTSSLATAWFLGTPQPLVSALQHREASDNAASASDPDTSTPQIDTARWEPVRLDGRPVSLFVAGPISASPGKVHVIGGDAAARESYAAAAEPVARFLSRWIPPAQASPLTVIDLPQPGTQAFADRGLLVAPLRAGDNRALAEALVYPMAEAAVPPDAPAWLREGLPEFLRLVYLESTQGRDRMLAELGSSAPGLQAAEASRGMDPAPLRTCVATTCARTKAAYALVMLRGLVGDAPLEQALAVALSGPGEPVAASSSEHAVPLRFEAALAQSSGKDLRWFFRDWFDADRGLPDLQIVQVAPRHVERNASVMAPREKRPVAGPIGAEPEAEPDDPRRATTTIASRNTAGLPEGSWLVAVEVQNNGDAAAEVPVTVRASGLQNQLPLRVPAHGRATIRVPFEATPEEVLVNDGTTPEQRSLSHHRTIDFGTGKR